VPLRTPGGIVSLPIHVVPQNVPLLIGIDILDAQQWYVRNVTDELVSTAGWTLPIARCQGHYWLRHGFDKLPASTRFTRTQLYHLHRHFRHPGAAKMYELLIRTKAEDLSPHTLAVLQDISEHCRCCQVLRSKEVTFSSGLKKRGESVFHRSVELDICCIDSRPALHITDKDTKYGASRFVRCSTNNPTTGQLSDTFVQAWAFVYIGMPDVVTTDRGTQFTSQDFVLALSYHGVKQPYTAVESHHSLGANERAHAVLRRVYLKTCHGHCCLFPTVWILYSRLLLLF
jgi:transposase InsO family protein